MKILWILQFLSVAMLITKKTFQEVLSRAERSSESNESQYTDFTRV